MNPQHTPESIRGTLLRPRTAAGPGTRARPAGRTLREWLTFAAFVAPNLCFLAAFSYWPLLQNVYLSFVEWDMISPEKLWIGLENWHVVLSDRRFRQILGNTLGFTGGSVGLTLVLGLALALLLNQRLVLRNGARAILFTPTILPGAAIAVVWVYMFDPNFGLIKAVLAGAGVPGPRWLTDPAWAMPAVILVYVWKNAGYSVVVLLAGLQGIPRDLYEAARVDGAGAWQRFRHVTIPGLGPIALFLVITSVLGSFQAFDIIRVMTAGGPVIATTTLIYQLYIEGFTAFHAGRAGVYAVILFAIMLTLTVVQLRVVERRVTYNA
jgi:multiple sugar transport system permease protein/sn-glycerol 3-phosphate transport system permease protein